MLLTSRLFAKLKPLIWYLTASEWFAFPTFPVWRRHPSFAPDLSKKVPVWTTLSTFSPASSSSIHKIGMKYLGPHLLQGHDAVLRYYCYWCYYTMVVFHFWHNASQSFPIKFSTHRRPKRARPRNLNRPWSDYVIARIFWYISFPWLIYTYISFLLIHMLCTSPPYWYVIPTYYSVRAPYISSPGLKWDVAGVR